MAVKLKEMMNLLNRPKGAEHAVIYNIRFYVLLFSFLFSALVYAWVITNIPAGSLQIIRLTQTFALTAVTFLYVTLLAGPLCYVFRSLPFRSKYLHSRRALGVSAFYFAALHASFAFFGLLGGFPGLPYLSSKYLLAISFSFTALVILSLMASTSFNFMVVKLGSKWKALHRFVYLAATLVLIHALMLGTHFTDLSDTIPQIFFVALILLLGLESFRLDNYLQSKFMNLPKPGIAFGIFLLAVGAAATYIYLPSGSSSSPFSVHNAHIQIAQQAQNGQTSSNLSSSIPGLQGDRTKRFTVSFNNPMQVAPNQDTRLSFEVFDASSGNQVESFQKVYDKFLHLIIVDSELQYFTHIHPTLNNNKFEIDTKFPKKGKYHLYLNYQPFGAIEQQTAFTLNVGNVSTPNLSKAEPDSDLTKTFGDYQIKLSFPTPLKADQLSVGQQLLTFTINKEGQPVTNLKPYLAAFGHLVMINQETFDYLHVHPNRLIPPVPNENGGPNVEFLPLGLYGPIKPGIYRVFAQFNPNGKLIVADFTIKID